MATEVLELPVEGMDCASCAGHVKKAIEELAGVASVDVLFAVEKVRVSLDPKTVGVEDIRRAVSAAGYKVPSAPGEEGSESVGAAGGYSRQVLAILGLVFGIVVFVVVVGEWLGLFEAATERVPLPLGILLVVLAGFDLFRNVLRQVFRRRIISHTLMSLGVVAALAVGQWATALVVVLFMRVGEYVEEYTTNRARRAVKQLTALAPETARVEREGEEREVPIGDVRAGEIVVVRPGEKIPVDGEVVEGVATVNQATITGESMPVEVGAGSHVYAATFASLGGLRVRVSQVGADTTFGRIVKLVEEAESNRAEVQRLADRVSGYLLPIVLAVAALTLVLRRDPLAVAAVLVVACSCSFALATPVAMLASIGAGAKRGLLIKGGKYLELLARADVLLLDKTGTLTVGRPRIESVTSLNGFSEDEILTLAGSAEWYSEHPLAEAVRESARARELPLRKPQGFSALPGFGVEAVLDGRKVRVGNARIGDGAAAIPKDLLTHVAGKTLLYLEVDGRAEAVLAAADVLRPEVPEALRQIRKLGIKHIELLTGDNEATAKEFAKNLGISYSAELLPEDKIEKVKSYQDAGHVVVMVGDGVNDAPALAQADVGIAMGVAGSDVSLEAAHLALLRDDWELVPQAFAIAKRTMRVVKGNFLLTALYNVVGLSLAAFGIMPPIVAAAAQSLPDLGILGNSARLLRD